MIAFSPIRSVRSYSQLQKRDEAAAGRRGAVNWTRR
jgi:hypothetical protein